MVKKFKWYPTEDEKKPFSRKSKTQKRPMRAHKRLEPGAVCIVLSGRFQGRRVVFLKSLPSGMALVTGPYKVNGVPLRRMNPAYLLATSTKIPVSGNVPTELNDKYFAKPAAKKKSEEDKFFAESAQGKKTIPEQRKEMQAKVDKPIMEKLEKIMKQYLGSRFTLRNNMKPHEMVF